MSSSPRWAGGFASVGGAALGEGRLGVGVATEVHANVACEDLEALQAVLIDAHKEYVAAEPASLLELVEVQICSKRSSATGQSIERGVDIARTEHIPSVDQIQVGLRMPVAGKVVLYAKMRLKRGCLGKTGQGRTQGRDGQGSGVER